MGLERASRIIHYLLWQHRVIPREELHPYLVQLCQIGLEHPDIHFELHSLTNAMLVAPPVASHGERVYQIFGKETLQQLIPIAATTQLSRIGLPPPPWLRRDPEEDQAAAEPGEVRVHGFVSKPEVQKLNRNSIFVFVNQRIIRDRLIQHAITDAYRNILPPTVFPVVLLFLEMPAAEVNRVSITSKADRPIFLMAGDIILGGKQDRENHE